MRTIKQLALVARDAPHSGAELVRLALGSDEPIEAALEQAGGLHGLIRADPDQLRAAGFSARAIRKLQANFALARACMQATGDARPVLRYPDQIGAYMTPRISTLPIEEFWVLSLSARNRLLRAECVARGGASSVALLPADVLRSAIRAHAVAMVLVHNHPSGDPAPSIDDFVITKRLRQAGAVAGIHVVDHVVIGASTWHSIASTPDWGSL